MAGADRRGDACADGRLPLLVLRASPLAPEITDLERWIATPEQARELLGLPARPAAHA